MAPQPVLSMNCTWARLRMIFALGATVPATQRLNSGALLASRLSVWSVTMVMSSVFSVLMSTLGFPLTVRLQVLGQLHALATLVVYTVGHRVEALLHNIA